jgi:hypothetical protein
MANQDSKPLVRACVVRQQDGRYQLSLHPLELGGVELVGVGIVGIYGSLGAAMAAAYGHAWQAGLALQGVGLGA